MIIDFSNKGKVKFTMYDYIAVMLDEIPEETKEGEAPTLYGYHLFIINKVKPENMNQEDTIMFHNVTSKLLYLANKDMPDLPHIWGTSLHEELYWNYDV